MVTLLITSAVIVTILGIAVYFWQKPNASAQSPSLPLNPASRGLFTGQVTQQQIASEEDSDREKLKTAILERAATGDKAALQDAHSIQDPELYSSALQRLITAAGSDAQLLSLISYITRAKLPVTPQLAVRVFEVWKKSPDRSGTAKTLHIVALSNDASLYISAVDTAMQLWREGRLSDVSPIELSALMDGEYWLLSPQVRSSGAGFLLKRTLANARRELKAQAHVSQ